MVVSARDLGGDDSLPCSTGPRLSYEMVGRSWKTQDFKKLIIRDLSNPVDFFGWSLVDEKGIEPSTSALRTPRSPI